MTAFAIFALTTAGPVQIQRISRERAPLSMMVLGRGSERLAISDRYDDFVYPGGGPVEKFFGPFPEGGFRLEVSAPSTVATAGNWPPSWPMRCSPRDSTTCATRWRRLRKSSA